MPSSDNGVLTYSKASTGTWLRIRVDGLVADRGPSCDDLGIAILKHMKRVRHDALPQ